jgi:hypothetical protein
VYRLPPLVRTIWQVLLIAVLVAVVLALLVAILALR